MLTGSVRFRAGGCIDRYRKAATIASAVEGTGQGGWDFAADSGVAKSLAVVIPGDAGAGTYQSTLTFRTAPPVDEG